MGAYWDSIDSNVVWPKGSGGNDSIVSFNGRIKKGASQRPLIAARFNYYPTAPFVFGAGAGAGAGAGVDAAGVVGDDWAAVGEAPEPRILIILFKMLNQNGEPCAAAKPVMRIPNNLANQPPRSFIAGKLTIRLHWF